MNTQRPEWNDANNALAGNGLSVVTTSYLHRYILYLERILKDRKESFSCFHALAEFLRSMNLHLEQNPEKTTERMKPVAPLCVISVWPESSIKTRLQ